MSPLKFFRHYGRTAVLVIMAGLLVIFLIEPVFMRNARDGGRSNEVIGEAFGQPLTTGHLVQGIGDYHVLKALKFDTRFIDGRIDNPNAPPLRDEEAGTNAYLLMEEARRMGVTVGRDQVLSQLQAGNVNDAVLEGVRRETHRSLDSIYDTVGRFLAMIHAALPQTDAAGDSLPRLERSYRDRSEQATLQLSVIDVAAFRPKVPEPTEDELRAFFEASKDRPTGHTEERLEFGYRRPDRLTIEYLTVDPLKILSRVRVSDKEVRRFFDERKAAYAADIAREAGTTQPATPPDFDGLSQALKDRVRGDARLAKAVEEAQKLVNRIQQELAEPWMGAARGADHFREAPPAERIAALTALRDKFSKEFPVEYSKAELIEVDKLGSVPGLGMSRLRLGTGEMGFPQLAARVRGLAKLDPNDNAPALAINEPSPVMSAAQPNPADPRSQRVLQSFVFRVSDVAPSGPPASIEEVRAAVRDDFITARAWEMAGQRARELGDLAGQVGLAEAVNQAADLKKLMGDAAALQALASQPAEKTVAFFDDLGPFPGPANFTRNRTYIPRIIVNEGLHEAVFAASPPASQPGATQPARSIVVVPSARFDQWIVAQVDEIKPLYAGDFEARRPQLATQSEQQRRNEFLQLWFNPAAVHERTRLKLQREQ